MSGTGHLIAVDAAAQRSVTLVLFAVVVLASLGITAWAARYRKTRDEFFTAGRGLTGMQNGWAIAGDSLSASAVLGSVGLVSLFGYDGFVFGVANVVGYTLLLLVAGCLDESRLRAWLAELPPNVVRGKGVVLVGDAESRVVQFVSGRCEVTELPADAAGAMESSLVLIGSDLDRAMIERGFDGCVLR